LGAARQQGKGDVTQYHRDTAAQQPSTALAAACATDLPQPAAASSPWRTAPRGRLIPLFEARSDKGRRERPGSPDHPVPVGRARPRAARRRSSAKPRRSHPQGAQRGRGAQPPSALTATAAHNPARSAGRAAHARTPAHLTRSDTPRPADLPAEAVDARALAATSRRTTATAGARAVDARALASRSRTTATAGARTTATARTRARALTQIPGTAAAPHPTNTSAFRLPTYLQEEWAGRKAFHTSTSGRTSIATRPSLLATAGVRRETPAATNPIWPARVAVRKEEN